MTTNTTVSVDQSAVGIGKTYNALRHAIQFEGRYIFVTERTRSLTEIENRITTMSRGKVKVEAISSETSSVKMEIEALPNKFENGHIIILCTHQAMMMSDLSDFHDWHIIIDEVPNILMQHKVQSKLDRAFFERHYELEDQGNGWSQVFLTDAGSKIESSDLAQDDSHRHLRLFHARVKSGLLPVLTDLKSWKDMTHANTEWTWWTLFTIEQLKAFASIKFLGADFMDSLTAKMLQARNPEFEWKPFSSKSDFTAQKKTVTIKFFMDRSATRYYFESGQGQDRLAAIGKYLNKVLPTNSIWSANDPARRPTTARKMLQPHMDIEAINPKQAGTGDYMSDYHDAAIIYASKPSDSSKKILDLLGMKEQHWVETNEYSTILQFVTRTSLRDIVTPSTNTVYVMSKDQAEYLHQFFSKQEHITSVIEYVDLQLVDVVKKAGRPIKIKSPEQAAADAQARREYNALKAKEARAKKKENK